MIRTQETTPSLAEIRDRPKGMLHKLDHDESTQRFRDVVLPHLSDALALARWLTGSPPDAEDVVQEACIRALAGIHGFADGNARAWVLRIVRNTAFTWLKRHRSRDLILVGDAAAVDTAVQTSGTAPLGRQSVDAEAILIRRAKASTIADAIRGLPLPLREVLVMRDVNGLSYREIAEVLTLPIGTVMSRLSRARALLIAKIAEES